MSTDNQDTTKAIEAVPSTPEQTQPAAATFEQLKAGCVGADSDFLCSQLENKATLSQAQSAWMAEQNKRIEAQEKATKQAEAAAKKPGFDIPGEGTANGAQATESGDAIEQFDAAVTAKMQGPNGLDRPKAVVAVGRANPQLHADYIRVTNEGRGRAVRRQIDEKYLDE